MTTSLTVRKRIKIWLTPALAPLIRRLRLPFDVLVPRLEALEHRVAELEAFAGSQAMAGTVDTLGENVRNVRGTVENLTRTWLRMQNEISRLATSSPEAALDAVQTRVADFEARVLASEGAVVTVDAGVSALHARLEEAERRWRDQLDERHRSVEMTLRVLLDRIEFLRRESMPDVRVAVRPVSDTRTRRDLPSRIVSGDRVSAALVSGRLRLNLGCGHLAHPDYINIDMRDLAGVDVVADVAALPFDAGTIAEISSTHLLEHFTQDTLRHQLLPYWRSLLRPGGRLRAIVPDGQAILAGAAGGSFAIEDLREALFGSQAYEGAFHYNLLTPESLASLLQEAGFVDIDVPVRGRRNGGCFEFELVAAAPVAVSASPMVSLDIKRQVVA